MYETVNTDITCPNCGQGYMIRKELYNVIKSNTNAYIYSCPICGFVHTIRSDEDMKEWIKSLDKPIEEEILKEGDPVNHPSHYETGKFESIDVMVETQGVEAVQNFCVCNAFKYIYRHRFKNGVEDIKKAIWYLNKYVELEDAKTN